MPAGRYDLRIEQGATFSKPCIWKDGEGQSVDLTSRSARMQIRPSHRSETVLLSLTSENGGLVLSGQSGMISIHITAEQTAGLPARGGVYDLEVVDADGFVVRLIEGQVYVSPEVTR